MNKMSERKRDAWVTAIFCLLVGGLIVVDTNNYPDVQGQGFGQGPGFYPKLLAGILIFLGALIVFKEWAFKGSEIAEQTRAKPNIKYLPVVFLIAQSVALIFLMKYLGFVMSSFFLIILTVFLIRRPTNIKFMGQDLIFSVGMTALVYLVFEIFVGIDLPNSIFWG
jgi:hypothetical protein